MNDNTNRLREIFLDIAGEETVTERQEETRSHAPSNDGDASVESLIKTFLEEEGEGKTRFDVDQLATIAVKYFEGSTDAEIAARLGSKSLDKSVTRARIMLHLFRERDLDAPFDLDNLRTLREQEWSQRDIADELGVSTTTVRHYLRVIERYDEAQSVPRSRRRQLQEAINESGRGVKIDLYDGLGEALDGSQGAAW